MADKELGLAECKVLESFERHLHVILLSCINLPKSLAIKGGVVGEVNFLIKKLNTTDRNLEKYCCENALGAFNAALQLKKLYD